MLSLRPNNAFLSNCWWLYNGLTPLVHQTFKLYSLNVFQSDHIRTIIKARGISWQQVAGSGISNTFAVFRVDAKHHLVSLAAKLAPSPDWIVGVSALELCNVNCTWTMSATLPLYPYDVGTDDGITYTVSIWLKYCYNSATTIETDFQRESGRK